MTDRYEINQKIEEIEQKMAQMASIEDVKDRILTGQVLVAWLDNLRQMISSWQTESEIRTRTRPDITSATEAAAVDYSVIRMAQEKAYHDRIDHSKITKFLLYVKGSPLPDSLIFFLRESGYFDKDGDRDEVDA